MNSLKILYLEGRPNAHILHRRLAQSIGCDIDYVDAKVRWQDQGMPSMINVVRWFRNARYLGKKYAEYQIILVDNLHFTPVLMNLFFVKNKKKLVVHLGSHTLYFMRAKKYSRMNLWLHKFMLRHYDVLICEGAMARHFASDLLNKKLPPAYVTFLGPPSERFPALSAIAPSTNSHLILIIANGPSPFRLYYKGLDTMIKAFDQAHEKLSSLRLKILGQWSEDVVKKAMHGISQEGSQCISFEGKVVDIHKYLSQAGLCLHCTRGDAFPTSTLEAMAAGVPTLVSEWTGTKEVVEQVDNRLIVEMDENAICDRILWYYQLSQSERNQLSTTSRIIAKKYTEEKAIDHYQNTFKKICEEFGI